MSHDSTAPIPNWPPVQQAPLPPGARRRRPPLWGLVAGGVALVGLVAGLLVWQPWNPPPNAPTAISAISKTATSVDVSWTASKGGATPSHYVVYRDGRQAGTVPASQTSWTDTGLTPGSRHQYTVAAQGGGQQSGPSTAAAATTITPPPVGLTVTKATYTSVSVRWSPSPQGPAPDGYTIYVGTSPVDSVPGSVNSYQFTGLTAGQDYQVSLTARWGSATSGPSSALSTPTLDPPLSGSVPLTYETTSTPGGGAWGTVGQHWTDNWQFSADCGQSSCTLTSNGEFAPPGLAPRAFTVRLAPSGGGYSGSTTAQVTDCKGVSVHNSITVSIAPKSGAVRNGSWTVWSGTMQLSSPYVQANSTYYCPSQSWNFHLTGSSSSGGSTAA